MNPNNIAGPLKIIRGLFLVNFAVWLVFGLISFGRISSGSSSPTSMTWVMPALMFANAAAMLGCGLWIERRKKWIYYPALILVLANLLLSITDEFGVFDVFTLVMNTVLLSLLFIFHRKILYAASETSPAR